MQQNLFQIRTRQEVIVISEGNIEAEDGTANTNEGYPEANSGSPVCAKLPSKFIDLKPQVKPK